MPRLLRKLNFFVVHSLAASSRTENIKNSRRLPVCRIFFPQVECIRDPSLFASLLSFFTKDFQHLSVRFLEGEHRDGMKTRRFFQIFDRVRPRNLRHNKREFAILMPWFIWMEVAVGVFESYGPQFEGKTGRKTCHFNLKLLTLKCE